MPKEPNENPQEKSEIDQIKEELHAEAAKKKEKELQIANQNEEIKRLLRLLPFQIFILVADADDKIDQKEVAQFKEILSNRAKNCSTNYTKRMFHTTLVNYSDLTKRYFEGGIKKDIKMVYQAAGLIQKCTSEKVMTAILNDLKELAVAIAEASGGIMGLSNPISKKEEAMIIEISQAFDQAMEGAKLDLNSKDEQ